MGLSDRKITGVERIMVQCCLDDGSKGVIIYEDITEADISHKRDMNELITTATIKFRPMKYSISTLSEELK